MPSSFDPLGLVKAMGPQRDPYSWAELYAQDASKHQLTREELKNRLLIQEMTREERAKEGAADRASREKMHGEAERGRASRWKDRVEGKVGGGAGQRESRVQILPPGSLSHDEYIATKALNPKNAPDVSRRSTVTIGGKSWYLPESGTATPVEPFKPKMVPRGRSKYDDDDDED